MKIKNNFIYVGVAVCVVALLVFGILKIVNMSKGTSSNNFADNGVPQNTSGEGTWGGGQGQGGQGRGNFKPLSGIVASISSFAITMTASDNSTKQIDVSSTTRITKMDNGARTQLTLADIKTGDKINVMASDTTTAEITAQMIIVGDFTPPTGGGYREQDNNAGSQDNGSPTPDSSSSSQI